MNKEEMITIMKETLEKRFIDGLKTDTYKEALETVDNIESMTDSEFFNLVYERISILDEEEKQTASTAIENRIRNWSEDEPLSLREIILLDIQSMIRSHEFSEKHHEKLKKVDIKKLTMSSKIESIELSPSEILLLEYLDGVSVELKLPGYFMYEYSIDYEYSLERMIGAGYITFADVEYSLKKCSVQELKRLLKDNQLKTTGKKDELVSRICSHIPQKNLAMYEKKYFALTSKGETLLLENSHIKYFHSMKNQIQLSIEEANEYKKHHETVSNGEIAFALLNERLKKEQSEKNWGLFRNTYYSKAVVCFFEKDNRQQLEYLIDVCYMDKVLDERYRMANPNYPLFANEIIDSIHNILQTEQIRKEEFERIFQDALYSFFKANAKYDMPFNNKDEEETFEKLSEALGL